MIRNNDVHHDFRQDSDLFYLSGFEEAESVLVIASQKESGQQVNLFLRQRDPEREVWDGVRLGVERAPETLGIDQAYPIEELEDRLPDLLQGAHQLYYTLGVEGRADDDVTVLEGLARVRRTARKGKVAPTDVIDTGQVLHEMRLKKDDAELDAMRQAADLTGRGHTRAMAITRPGIREYQVSVAMEYEWLVRGAGRNAYPSIVGSGPNACVLHYRAGERILEDGDLVLVDAGCEIDYYASDVTRTWPVSGRFSTEQKAIYQIVLDAQKGAIDVCRAGHPMEIIHQTATRLLVEGLVAIGLLQGEVDDIIEDESYKRFYMHNTSHWIGMDVHDVGAYYSEGVSRPLEPGMVLTVEPGIYIAPGDDAVPEEFRGIGVRIEDDILVTEGDPEVLTASIPKETSDIEALVGTQSLEL
jgi:Xaa-Pro aminopeptidase